MKRHLSFLHSDEPAAPNPGSTYFIPLNFVNFEQISSAWIGLFSPLAASSASWLYNLGMPMPHQLWFYSDHIIVTTNDDKDLNWKHLHNIEECLISAALKLFVSPSLWPPFGVRRTVMAAPTETFWTFSERTKENLENVPFSNSDLKVFFNIWQILFGHTNLPDFKQKLKQWNVARKIYFSGQIVSTWPKTDTITINFYIL